MLNDSHYYIFLVITLKNNRQPAYLNGEDNEIHRLNIHIFSVSNHIAYACTYTSK